MSNAVNLRVHTEEHDLAIMKKDYPELEALIQIYPEEAAKNLLNNKSKLLKIAKFFKDTTSTATVNTMLMTCSTGCELKDACILYRSELAPIGYSCPIEKKIIMEMELDIMTSLDIDRNDPIEMEMLWDLIETKILDMRASGKLRDGKLVQIVEQKVGQATVSREEISPTLEMKIELKKLKHSIIDAFAASRRAKKKYGMNADASTLEAMLRQAAANVDGD